MNNKDISKLEPIITLSNTIEELIKKPRRRYPENESDEDLSIAKQELPVLKDLEIKNKELLIALCKER